MTAKKLQIVFVVGPALASGNDVIDRKVAEREVLLAARTTPLLFAIQGVLVGFVIWQLINIGALGDIGACSYER